MPAAAVLRRLALHGLWCEASQPAAHAVIAEAAARSGRLPADVAQRLARDPQTFGVAVRREWRASLLWYGRRADEVLTACLNAPPGQMLIEVLNLRESDSELPEAAQARADGPGGLVAAGGELVYDDTALPGKVRRMDAAGRPTLELFSLEAGAPSADQSAIDPFLLASPAPTRSGGTRGKGGTGGAGAAPPAAQTVQAWPRLDAPGQVEAGEAFEVEVGLSASAQGAHGAAMALPVPAGASALELVVELLADGFRCDDGWRQPMPVEVGRIEAARVRWRLVASEPTGADGHRLGTLGVRFLLGGVVCGSAERPIVVRRSGLPEPTAPPQGTPWLARAATATPVATPDLTHAADLTIEIAHPDANPARGRYLCSLSTPHPIALDPGPHPIELGEDAKTFARSIVEQVRQFAGDALTQNLFDALGDLVAQCLPRACFDALAAVAAHVAPQVPAVLLVSAEPYVPWELARLDPVLDPSRPACLSAQVLLGRWWRDSGPGGPAARSPRPPADPPARLQIGAMAVMAAQYKAESGLRRLPEAEAEAKALAASHGAVLLAASGTSLKQLLDARLEQGLDTIGAADAVHFAGHGDFDPARPDGSMMFLADGRPLSSMLFRSARYGDAHQPLAFFNACMIGIGGELLGDAGGFPGNCLRGGFGGVAGALWEVDDGLARDVAIDFWRRVLPAPQGLGEPVAAVWRDLRARYAATDDPAAPPHATYLAYVFYGHPRLRLEPRPPGPP